MLSVGSELGRDLRDDNLFAYLLGLVRDGRVVGIIGGVPQRGAGLVVQVLRMLMLQWLCEQLHPGRSLLALQGLKSVTHSEAREHLPGEEAASHSKDAQVGCISSSRVRWD